MNFVKSTLQALYTSARIVSFTILSGQTNRRCSTSNVECSQNHVAYRIMLLFALIGLSFLPRASFAQVYGYGSAQQAYQNCVGANGVNPTFEFRCVPWTFSGENGFSDVTWYPQYGESYTGPGPQYQFFAYAGAQPIKNNGSGCPCDGGAGSSSGTSGASTRTFGVMAGDPIHTATGNAYRQDDDYAGSAWLTFRRFYNSAIVAIPAEMGPEWRHSFDRALQISGSPATSITLVRPDGKGELFKKVNGLWTTDPDVADVLTEIDDAQGNATGYIVFIAALRDTETYSATTGLLQAVTDETGQGITLSYSTSSTPASVAPYAGLLLTVTDPEGRQLDFTYTSSGLVYQVTQPDGGQLTYGYDATSNLVSVQYPDGKTRQYIYNESAFTAGTSLPNVITGIVDEAGVRYESTTYNSIAQATASSFAGNVGTTQITYNSDGTSTVQYPLGASMAMGYATSASGLIQESGVSQPCGSQCNQPWQSITYDANSYPQSTTDFNGNVTATTYEANGLLDQQVDAQGSASQRTTNTTWNTALRVPLTRTVSNASGTLISSTAWVYNTSGQTLARCEVDPTNSAAASYTCAATGTVPPGVRRWTYTYCTTVSSGCPLIGLLLTSTGPRTDLSQTTTYSYYTTSSATNCGTPGSACYQPGDLHQITDALGHVTTIASYDGAGRVTRLTDPNGVNTDMTYTPRGWLASRSVGGSTTTFTYMPYGNVKTLTDPDGVVTTFGYDTAHRLTDITDAQGNDIHYTLDAAGNKTAEQISTASGTVVHSLSRSYNALGQITAVIDGLSQTVFNAGYSDSYDANGNLTHSADGLNIQRQQTYDALNRLKSTIDNYNGTDTATANTTTTTNQDALDRVTSVTDPTSLVTTYSYDGLSDTTGQQSPDTGTASRTFDAAGNVLTKTDAKGITVTNTYDALDRLISTSYPHSTQNVTYTYDDPNTTTGCGTSYPTGRLTRIIEATVTTVYCYDARGNVIRKQQITASNTDAIGYSITAAGRLNGIVYPSGTLISYARDGDGRIQSMSVMPVNGTASTAVSGVTYQPFGPVSGYTLGNGQVIAHTYDANYRLTDLTSPAFNSHVARDAMGDITALGNAPGANPATETYQYDPLYRLLIMTEASGSVLESVTYNQTGDRLSKIGSGLATGKYSYNTGTHQLNATGNAARSVDADGNTTAITEASSTYGFGYNDRNRMTVAQFAGSTVGSYTYNALNQRIQKVANSAIERYDYTEASQILGEYGATNRDYLWMGSIPIADVDTTGSTSIIAYVTVDDLNTPRAISDASGNTIWQFAYQGNAFEEEPPTSNSYVYNLRSAGEYADSETGLNDNVSRSRDLNSWRFTSSDPKGLAGGIDTYAAVENNPLSYVDPLGLTVWVCRDPAFNGKLGPIDHYWLKTDTYEVGMGTAAAGANAGNQYDSVISPVETVSHAGRSNGPGAECLPVPGVNESTVNNMIKPGRPLGYFVPPFNYCHSFVNSVLFKAHGKDPFDVHVPDPAPPAYVPGYGPESKPSQ